MGTKIWMGTRRKVKTETIANDLVRFLSGKWQNTSFEVAVDKPIKKEQYNETMVVKDEHTLTITAHDFRDGKDLTKDMNLILIGEEIRMEQGDFSASGKREGNVYSLSGNYKGTEYRFRLYTMVNKYVFHREMWKNGEIEQIDMSYLVRQK